MCGLAGFIGFDDLAAPPAAVADAMARTLAHRGPDDHGVWVDAEAGVALSHRRLSIVDLSPAGHQPMHSASGRYAIVFNGEIYNHAALRAGLEAAGKATQWRGHSDTEVLLAAVEAWGLRTALEKSIGMFAIALYDRAERRLMLARDRLGEKPLYWGRIGHSFAFASEVKALTRLPGWTGRIDRDALALFMRWNNVPAPRTIYAGIAKLPPASILTYDATRDRETVESFWSARDAAVDGADRPFCGGPDEAAIEVEMRLSRAIRDQMVADVPLGAFLSGGIDSSTVVALMQRQSSRPVRTFSIGFAAEGYDEAGYARAVARRLGTEHTELYVTEADALDVVPRLPEIYCEPFADSSGIPTAIVSRLARRHVTVSLSGDGGDELFSGYDRYALAASAWPLIARVPPRARAAAAGLMTRLSPARWDAALRLPLSLVPERRRPPRVGEQMHKAARTLAAHDETALYAALVSHWPEPGRVVLGANEPAFASPAPPLTSAARRMMYRDLTGYLSDDVLAKVDRAAMATSLETRVPFLDHRLVEFAFTLPEAILRRGGKSKWPLRAILERYLPLDLVDRPKMGFAVPIDRWLRGALRPWAEELLAPARLAAGGYFDTALVRATWEQHLAGRANHQHRLWCVLMFEAWRDRVAASASDADSAIAAAARG